MPALAALLLAFLTAGAAHAQAVRPYGHVGGASRFGAMGALGVRAGTVGVQARGTWSEGKLLSFDETRTLGLLLMVERPVRERAYVRAGAGLGRVWQTREERTASGTIFPKVDVVRERAVGIPVEAAFGVRVGPLFVLESLVLGDVSRVERRVGVGVGAGLRW